MSFFYKLKRGSAALALWMLYAFLAASGNVYAQEVPVSDVLTLQEVFQYTYEQNPTLNAARAELRAVEEKMPQAFSGWLPTVQGDASITATDTDGSNFGTASGSTAKDMAVSLNQPLFRGGRTMAGMAAARHTIDARSALLNNTVQNVLVSAATAYMDVLRDQALLNLSREARDVIAKQFEATQDRFDVGELTRTDVSQAEARLAKAEADITTARGQLNSTAAVFYQVVGIAPGKLQRPEIKADIPETLDEIVALAESNSPVVVSAQSAHRASEKDADGVFGELLPEVGFMSSWNKTFDPNPGLLDEQTTKMVGISASIPLYQAGAVRSRVREAKHVANQRYIEILETKRDVRQKAVHNWSQLQAARAEIRSREAQVKASKVAQEGVHYESDLGSRTVLDALDADQELLDAQVALVTAERNEVVALLELLATIGSLNPETLDFNAPDGQIKHSLLENTEMDVDSVTNLD